MNGLRSRKPNDPRQKARPAVEVTTAGLLRGLTSSGG